MEKSSGYIGRLRLRDVRNPSKEEEEEVNSLSTRG